ncbi:hypothetical protein C8R43DRAFT_453043 [Mycena crocata]|nr:hypothetical protein C8R43DRAFT_453043 [Mycena crocata]
MRRGDMAPRHLRLRFPTPQLSMASLDSGQAAIVQDNPYFAAGPQEVAPQDDAPQRAQSVGMAAESTTATTGTAPLFTERASQNAMNGQRTRSDSTFATTSATAVIAPTSISASISPASVLSTGPIVSSSILASSTLSPSAASSSLLLASSSALSSLSSSVTSASSSFDLASPSTSSASSTSAAPSGTSAATSGHSYALTHGAPFFAGITLGILLLIAFSATLGTYIFRFRSGRRDRAAAETNIGWDPVVLDGKQASMDKNRPLDGDRDVGEPKRTGSFLSGRESLQPQDGTIDPAFLYSHHPNPFDENAYYSPHQIRQLPDSTAYPLPPRPLSLSLSNNGPYPTSRPLPAHLAEHDPHRLSPSTSGYTTAASSRSGSVRSHLHSASTLGPLYVTNGTTSAAFSRATTALGVHSEVPQHAEFDFDVPRRQSEQEFGTPREQEARPRFMSLGGRGLDVPWRRESFAARGGATPGWTTLGATGEKSTDTVQHEHEPPTEGWTQTLRASVLTAFQAVTGTGSTPSTDNGDDGLTHAPSMSRKRREQGWERFAAEERERDLQRESSMSSHGGSMTGAIHVPHGHLTPPAAALQLSGMSTASEANTVRTENSRVPLIPRSRPSALVSSASSIYSTVSAVPSRPQYGQDGYGRGGP